MENTEKFWNELNDIINNYAVFKSIAENIDWIDIEERHFDWNKIYPCGIMLDLYNFPKNYLQIDFKRAYVRAVLSQTAFREEWESDFWDMPVLKRKFCLANGRDLYSSYINFNELRQKTVTSDELWAEITEFAGYNKIDAENFADIKNAVYGGESMEIGGSYCGDHSYITVCGDKILLTDLGVWD